MIIIEEIGGSEMKRFILMTCVCFALSGCASYIELQNPNEEYQNVLKAQEDRYAQKAEGNAETYRIIDYRYLGIEMFKPYPSGSNHVMMVDRGINIYRENGDDVFSNKYIGANEAGVVIAVTGIESFKERTKAINFLNKVVAALQPSYPFLRESDSSLEDYSVWFLPKEEYIKWYISHEESAEFSTRDYQFGYKSTYWYFGNRMADDKLLFLSISLKESEGIYTVTLHVESKEANRIATSARKNEINDFSNKILH